MILIEHLLNTGRRPKTSKKGEKPSTQLGRTKGEKREREREKRNEGRTELLRGNCERGKESARMEGDPQSLKEKHTSLSEEGKAGDTQTIDTIT